MCQARVFHSQAQAKMHKFNTKTQNEPLLLSFKKLWRFYSQGNHNASMSCNDKYK
jgi:hypothetical protein